MEKQKIWIDAQLSPIQALWINQNFAQFHAVSMRQLGLRDATDKQIYLKARQENAIVITKDIDFLYLQQQLDPPPAIILITAGNTSNARMKEVFTLSLEKAITLIKEGNSLVEIR